VTPQEKFDSLRKAALNLVGVPSDDIGELVAMLGFLHAHSQDDDARASLGLMVALIETHPSKDDKP
jgi:hypothetical protein